MAIQGPKDFYTIADFYNHIKQEQYAPTTHRHFQVYLHPILFEKAHIVPFTYINRHTFRLNAGDKNYEYNTGKNKFANLQETKNFFDNWFQDNTHEQFSLAIQQVTLPTQVDVQTNDFESPLGHYRGVVNDQYYGKITNSNVTFQLIDQLTPFLQKRINQWIFEVHRCKGIRDNDGPYNTGVIPKVNIVIKYFKQTEVFPGNSITPNFIYYFTNAYPNQFTTCTIDHNGSDGDNDLRRTVTFSFDQMYVFQDAFFAERFGLGYLFDKVTI